MSNFFSTLLTSLMKEKKLSKQALANEIGISRQAISQFANGANLPSLEKLIALAEYFNVSMDFLLGRSVLLKKPDGILEYCFKATKSLQIGKIKYSFGILRNGNFFKRFLFVDEIEGDLIDVIIDSTSQYEFLSLTYLLNQELDLNYDALHNNGVDIIIKYRGKYQELCIDMAESARFGYVDYEKYLDDWLKLSSEEKVKRINEIMAE
ncbi:helix-turn-helix domain-containing protein [Pectinatus brassicae]|uniref:Transcriptional regulator with XRE-family HTH domain n=1 Tax=Pectinatus brassicae TaxID=862415 RepID=A0A840UN13_9FIRM|nr:helix-turn-helix transcriptional regulator [Pectinatus brassicae]MBB5337600.1 transcriptional regulator with XRE-family HTH domain [Pectinatus brassicae]